MKLPRPQVKAAGFTLIEVIIASALMALVLVSAYACLSAGFASQKIVEPRSEIIQNARVALALMAADLRGACVLAPQSEFVGMTRTLGDAEADNLDFATHNFSPRHAREGDYCQESFFVDQDPVNGSLVLYRRRNPTIALDPLSGGTKEEIARGVRGLKLEYYDGLDWYASWGEVKSASKAQTSEKSASNLSGLPAAVRITLYLDSHPKPTETPAAVKPEPPLVFQTVAFLNLAAAAASAGGGGPASANDSGNPAANSPASNN